MSKRSINTASVLEVCPECKNSASSEADACPYCGYLLKGRELLVTCHACKNQVIPENRLNPYLEQICPICQDSTEAPTKFNTLMQNVGTALFFIILFVFIWVIFFE